MRGLTDGGTAWRVLGCGGMLAFLLAASCAGPVAAAERPPSVRPSPDARPAPYATPDHGTVGFEVLPAPTTQPPPTGPTPTAAPTRTPPQPSPCPTGPDQPKPGWHCKLPVTGDTWKPTWPLVTGMLSVLVGLALARVLRRRA